MCAQKLGSVASLLLLGNRVRGNARSVARKSVAFCPSSHILIHPRKNTHSAVNWFVIIDVSTGCNIFKSFCYLGREKSCFFRTRGIYGISSIEIFIFCEMPLCRISSWVQSASMRLRNTFVVLVIDVEQGVNWDTYLSSVSSERCNMTWLWHVSWVRAGIFIVPLAWIRG